MRQFFHIEEVVEIARKVWAKEIETGQAYLSMVGKSSELDLRAQVGIGKSWSFRRDPPPPTRLEMTILWGMQGQTVDLVFTRTGNRGRRWWFCCPSCKRRTMELHQRPAASGKIRGAPWMCFKCSRQEQGQGAGK